MIAHTRIPNDRFPFHKTSSHSNQLDWPSWKHTNTAPVEQVVAVSEQETAFRVMTASDRLEAVIALLTSRRKKRSSRNHFSSQGNVTTTSEVTSVVFTGNTNPWKIAVIDVNRSDNSTERNVQLDHSV